MKNKIKYLNFQNDWSHQDLLNDFKPVSNPTKYTNLPDGEYLIRGDKKEHSIEYWVKDNIWYQVSVTTKDNGHYYCNAARYELFPCLKNKEWTELNKHWNKLNPHWKRAVGGKNQWDRLRELRRDIKKSFLK